jgi:hypothetical protein
VIVGTDLGRFGEHVRCGVLLAAHGPARGRGTFPANPSLAGSSAADGVSSRYVEMRDRGELRTLGDKTVPVAAWLSAVQAHVAGETVAAVVADRYKQAEMAEAMDRADMTAPVVWRGMGFRDGGEGCERFRWACFDGQVKSRPSLLLRSAFGDCVTLRDPANNERDRRVPRPQGHPHGVDLHEEARPGAARGQRHGAAAGAVPRTEVVQPPRQVGQQPAIKPLEGNENEVIGSPYGNRTRLSRLRIWRPDR